MVNVKNLLVLAISLLSALSNGFAQKIEKLPVDESTGKITYQEVVNTKGDQETLFNRCIGWINGYFNNPVNVTKVRDPESGEIKGIHRFKIYNYDKKGNKTDAGVIQYEFLIELKDDRYRVTVNEFIHRQASKEPVEKWFDVNDPQYSEAWESYLQQIDQYAHEFKASLKEGMTPETEKTEDDW